MAEHAPEQPRTLQAAGPLPCVLAYRRPVFWHTVGFDLDVARASAEIQGRLTVVPRGNDAYLVLPGNRKLPPSVVVRFEWQKRVLVDRRMLGNRYGTFDPSKHAGFTNDDSIDALHVRYLNAIFVRRQRFENLRHPGPQRTHLSCNLSRRVLPGIFSVWFTRSWEDDA